MVLPLVLEPRPPPVFRAISVELPIEPVWGIEAFEGFLIAAATFWVLYWLVLTAPLATVLPMTKLWSALGSAPAAPEKS